MTKVVETYNHFFFFFFVAKAALNLNLPQYEDPSVNSQQTEDLILWVIEQYKNHSSILAINAKFMG